MNTDKIYAEHIANEYSVKKESKVIALKKLDKKAREAANVFGLVFGITMTLVFGFGMCLAMGTLGSGKYAVLGIIIGIIGMFGVAINYPIYKKILEDSKAKYANDIIRLANEIIESK